MTEQGARAHGAVPSTNAVVGEMNVTLVAFVPSGTGPPVGPMDGRVLEVDVGGMVTVEAPAFAPIVWAVLERCELPQPLAARNDAIRSATGNSGLFIGMDPGGGAWNRRRVRSSVA